MVLDPLSALGVAGNIVQFVDFSCKIVSKTFEIYDSADGSTVENQELEAVTKNLLYLSKKIKSSSQNNGGQAATHEEHDIQDLCIRCEEISSELLMAPEELKIKRPCTKWRSFRQALNSVWSKSRIKGLSKRLEAIRRQIDTNLMTSVR